MVHIKGADEPVAGPSPVGHGRTTSRSSGVLSRLWSVGGGRCPPSRACWIVQSRATVLWSVWWGRPASARAVWCARCAAMAASRGVEVFTAFCESHTSQVPFHAVARLLRAATGVEGLDGAGRPRSSARPRSRRRPARTCCYSMTCWASAIRILRLPRIDPDARRRRLTALVNAASLARETPAVYVIEDAHWIDEVSESMLADFLTVIPQTPSLVLVTYRPEYGGALTRVHGAQTHRPCAAERSGDRSTGHRAARGRTPRSVGWARRSPKGPPVTRFSSRRWCAIWPSVACCAATAAHTFRRSTLPRSPCPPPLQAAIAARIDRLDPEAKRTLSAAAVIGSQFGPDLLEALGIEPIVDDLVVAELDDQVRLTRAPSMCSTIH